MNEPGYIRSGIWPGTWMRDVIKILGPRIAAEGMKTKLIVPDDVDAMQAYGRLQVILADPAARQYVGAVAYHIYNRGGEAQVKQIAEQYRIPIWMTEFSTGNDWFQWATIMATPRSCSGRAPTSATRRCVSGPAGRPSAKARSRPRCAPPRTRSSSARARPTTPSA